MAKALRMEIKAEELIDAIKRMKKKEWEGFIEDLLAAFAATKWKRSPRAISQRGCAFFTSRSLPAVAYLCAAINSGRRAEDASRDIECARRRQNHNSHQHGH
jgi:hypothetical protein